MHTTLMPQSLLTYPVSIQMHIYIHTRKQKLVKEADADIRALEFKHTTEKQALHTSLLELLKMLEANVRQLCMYAWVCVCMHVCILRTTLPGLLGVLKCDGIIIRQLVWCAHALV